MSASLGLGGHCLFRFAAAGTGRLSGPFAARFVGFLLVLSQLGKPGYDSHPAAGTPALHRGAIAFSPLRITRNGITFLW